MKKTILIVEDDIKIIEFLSVSLEKSGYNYLIAKTGKSALNFIKNSFPDLIILDLGLPDIDGTLLISKIRSITSTPILILSARTTEKDKVIALDYGADDYLIKPFSIEELLARLRVFFRRLNQENIGFEDIFTNGDLKIIFSSQEVYLKDQLIHLTPIEFNLLSILSKNVGKIITHNFILKEIWGGIYESDMLSLRVFMAGLRKKLKKIDSDKQYIQTQIGVGYKMIRF